jgi:hypothetical protein
MLREAGKPVGVGQGLSLLANMLEVKVKMWTEKSKENV